MGDLFLRIFFISSFLQRKPQNRNMDGMSQQQMQMLQQMAQRDPDIIKISKKAEFRALVHEHTQRCWDRCHVEQYARNSSLASSGQTCLFNCVNNWFISQNCVNEYMEKKMGNK